MHPIIEYLDSMDGSFDCMARYDAKIAAGFGADDRSHYAYLAGRYSAMLAELVRMIGPEKVRLLIEAREEIDRQS